MSTPLTPSARERQVALDIVGYAHALMVAEHTRPRGPVAPRRGETAGRAAQRLTDSLLVSHDAQALAGFVLGRKEELIRAVSPDWVHSRSRGMRAVAGWCASVREDAAAAIQRRDN